MTWSQLIRKSIQDGLDERALVRLLALRLTEETAVSPFWAMGFVQSVITHLDELREHNK